LIAVIVVTAATWAISKEKSDAKSFAPTEKRDGLSI
jgi:hypothetical protein